MFGGAEEDEGVERAEKWEMKGGWRGRGEQEQRGVWGKGAGGGGASMMNEYGERGGGGQTRVQERWKERRTRDGGEERQMQKRQGEVYLVGAAWERGEGGGGQGEGERRGGMIKR